MIRKFAIEDAFKIKEVSFALPSQSRVQPFTYLELIRGHLMKFMRFLILVSEFTEIFFFSFFSHVKV